jgi:hypothetical protein
MAEFKPFLVNQTRWSQALQSLAVSKGLDHVELLSQLTASVILENDRPETKYLAGERLAFGQLLFAAQGAGIVGWVGLRNPGGSGSILIIEKIRARPQGGAQRTVYLSLARAPTVTQANTEQPRDTRIQPTGVFGTAAPNIVGQIVSARSDTIVVVPFVVAEIVQAFSAATLPDTVSPAIWDDPIVLAPGDVAFVNQSDNSGGNTTNQQMQASFVWRERTMEPTET